MFRCPSCHLSSNIKALTSSMLSTLHATLVVQQNVWIRPHGALYPSNCWKKLDLIIVHKKNNNCFTCVCLQSPLLANRTKTCATCRSGADCSFTSQVYILASLAVLTAFQFDDYCYMCIVHCAAWITSMKFRTSPSQCRFCYWIGNWSHITTDLVVVGWSCSKKPRAPSFQIRSGWSWARLFFLK